MIRAAKGNELIIGSDYYSGRVISAYKAYGDGYSFCRFFGNGKGSGVIYNSSAVFCGEWEDRDELSGFIEINSPCTAEMSGKISESLEISGYDKLHREMFLIHSGDMLQDVREFPPLNDIYPIISEAFGEKEYDLWYADMSHRVRHGVSRTFMLDGGCACACVDFVHEGKGYISQLAVPENKRGNGFGKMLLGHISASLEKEGISAYLWAFDGLCGYYRRLGYSSEYADNIYINEIS